jgi:HTH-type transcriptional regulator/antitoxin HigA
LIVCLISVLSPPFEDDRIDVMPFNIEEYSMIIKPIKTEEDYDQALEDIESLFDSEPGSSEADKLEILVLLVEVYEEEHHAGQLPDPIEAIKYWMESRNLSRKDLEQYIGPRSRVSEVINKRGPLNLRMIRNLEDGLGIPSKILIQPYELSTSAIREKLEHE